MEYLATSSVPRQNSARKAAAPKDLWAAVRNGSPSDVDAALVSLKRSNGNIDARNGFGSTALHIAVWRNHIPIVKRLLAAGASVEIRDGESGWSSLHRALHFGHVAVAGVLIEAGANLLLEDTKGRTPVDLISGPIRQVINDPNNAGATEVFSWGNGANYQLGTGTAGIQKLPCRLDALQGFNISAIAAAKFHSMAVTTDGKLYSWGFGRGGRLGFSDFDIHSGQVAVITPRLVSCGIGKRRVKIIAVAKHHSLVATEGGEVFTWGSNREGQLGYTSVDTQPTPRRVTTLKARVVAAAIANKHSAVLTEGGEVFTWGCNKEGQLGYGTSNSASNPVPRVVEYVKGKVFRAVSAAKYHTVVLGSEGEVFTWGYKLVMPRRVNVTRNTKKAGNTPLKFHQAERLHIVAVAAGTIHSTVISDDGHVFYWFSADPNVRCNQVMLLSGHQAVSVAAGKYRTAVVTASGDIYAWECQEDTPLAPFRIHGIKHATDISVGENHSLAVAAVFTPSLPSCKADEVDPPQAGRRESQDLEEDLAFDEMGIAYSTKCEPCGDEQMQLPREPPMLKELCENIISQYVVEPKNALQLLEIADSVGAKKLRKHCEDLVLHNLDYILTVSPAAFAHVSPSLLADLERALDASSSQPWSHRLLPTPTALFPAIVDSEEDDCERGFSSRMRSLSVNDSSTVSEETMGSEGLFNQVGGVDQAVVKQLRALKKKLQQIEALELQQSRGHVLDHQQLAKLETKLAIRDAILALDPGMELQAISNECELPFALDSIAEGSLVKEVVNRRNRKGRRKSNKSGSEQVSVDESQKKLRNGQSNKANPKWKEASLEAQIERIEKPFRIAGKADQQKSLELTCSSENNMEPSPLSVHFNPSSSPLEKGNGNKREDEERIQIHGFVADALRSSTRSLPAHKKKQKKGGLSVFLSGALDCVAEVPAPVQAPPLPRIEGPAWGGAKRSGGLSSLREIQNQQTAEASNVLVDSSMGIHLEPRPLRTNEVGGERLKGPVDPGERSMQSPDTAATRYSLRQFIRTSTPIAVTPTKPAKSSSSINPDSSPTPWAGTSPLTPASSFKDIQMEQVKGKKQQKHGVAQVVPFCGGPTTLQASTSSAEKALNEQVPNRWFRPETHNASSIRCIQIEEQAMKEISRMYKNVKVVRSADLKQS